MLYRELHHFAFSCSHCYNENAFHLRLAMGLVSHGQQIGAWSGVGYFVWMAHWVCLRYSGCPIGAYEGG